MDKKEFKAMLADMVKAAGQMLIDNAEDLVGQTDLMSDFDININFPINEAYRMDGVPEISVYKSYITKEILDIMKREYGG